jgi:hypothetical protein
VSLRQPANTQYENAVPGFYVINEQTDIAVSRFDSEWKAQADAKRRNEKWAHVDATPLVVTVVHDCWEPGRV